MYERNLECVLGPLLYINSLNIRISDIKSKGEYTVIYGKTSDTLRCIAKDYIKIACCKCAEAHDSVTGTRTIFKCAKCGGSLQLSFCSLKETETIKNYMNLTILKPNEKWTV